MKFLFSTFLVFVLNISTVVEGSDRAFHHCGHDRSASRQASYVAADAETFSRVAMRHRGFRAVGRDALDFSEEAEDFSHLLRTRARCRTIRSSYDDLTSSYRNLRRSYLRASDRVSPNPRLKRAWRQLRRSWRDLRDTMDLGRDRDPRDRDRGLFTRTYQVNQCIGFSFGCSGKVYVRIPKDVFVEEIQFYARSKVLGTEGYLDVKVGSELVAEGITVADAGNTQTIFVGGVEGSSLTLSKDGDDVHVGLVTVRYYK